MKIFDYSLLLDEYRASIHFEEQGRGESFVNGHTLDVFIGEQGLSTNKDSFYFTSSNTTPISTFQRIEGATSVGSTVRSITSSSILRGDGVTTFQTTHSDTYSNERRYSLALNTLILKTVFLRGSTDTIDYKAFSPGVSYLENKISDIKFYFPSRKDTTKSKAYYFSIYDSFDIISSDTTSTTTDSACNLLLSALFQDEGRCGGILTVDDYKENDILNWIDLQNTVGDEGGTGDEEVKVNYETDFSTFEPLFDELSQYIRYNKFDSKGIPYHSESNDSSVLLVKSTYEMDSTTKITFTNGSTFEFVYPEILLTLLTYSTDSSSVEYPEETESYYSVLEYVGFTNETRTISILDTTGNRDANDTVYIDAIFNELKLSTFHELIAVQRDSSYSDSDGTFQTRYSVRVTEAQHVMHYNFDIHPVGNPRIFYKIFNDGYLGFYETKFTGQTLYKFYSVTHLSFDGNSFPVAVPLYKVAQNVSQILRDFTFSSQIETTAATYYTTNSQKTEYTYWVYESDSSGNVYAQTTNATKANELLTTTTVFSSVVYQILNKSWKDDRLTFYLSLFLSSSTYKGTFALNLLEKHLVITKFTSTSPRLFTPNFDSPDGVEFGSKNSVISAYFAYGNAVRHILGTSTGDASLELNLGKWDISTFDSDGIMENHINQAFLRFKNTFNEENAEEETNEDKENSVYEPLGYFSIEPGEVHFISGTPMFKVGFFNILSFVGHASRLEDSHVAFRPYVFSQGTLGLVSCDNISYSYPIASIISNVCYLEGSNQTSSNKFSDRIKALKHDYLDVLTKNPNRFLTLN